MKNVSVLLPYANPHVLDWVLKMKEISLNIGCVKSTQDYRPGYFHDYDNIDCVNYFYKGQEHKIKFLKELKNSDFLITLGLADVNLFKFRRYCKKNVKLIVLSEPFNPINSSKKMLIRKVWSLGLRSVYKDISFFCIGGNAVKEYYTSLGFNQAHYFNFGYFPSLSFSNVRNIERKDTVKVGFLGQLINRKGVDRLIKLIDFIDKTNYNCIVKIAGGGELKDAILDKINSSKDNRFEYMGLISDKPKVEAFLNEIDILFVPSYFDGWGAVINEALSKSCMIVASDKVFAAISIFGRDGLSVFEDDFIHIFEQVLSDVSIINSRKNRSKELFEIWNSDVAANEVSNFILSREYKFQILTML